MSGDYILEIPIALRFEDAAPDDISRMGFPSYPSTPQTKAARAEILAASPFSQWAGNKEKMTEIRRNFQILEDAMDQAEALNRASATSLSQ